jgi:hypothetical protein
VKPPRRRLVLPLLAALAAPLLAALVVAPEARSAPCTGSVDEARRHMEHGFDLYDKKQYPEAGAEFDAAYRAQPFSAFLCNAAMAYQEALDFPASIQRYKAFLAAEPNPPDLARIKKALAWLEAQQAAQLAAHAAAGDAGPDEVLAQADAGAPGGPPPVEMARSFRSQVVVISDPPDAPLTVWAKKEGAAPFASSPKHDGWEKITSGVKTPHDLALEAGEYHVVIDAFKDYRRSETDLSLLPGRVYEFKANLSQGEFMGFMRVLSTAAGALVYLDDPPPHKKPPWGRAPHGALIETGPHKLWVEAPGYETSPLDLKVEHGQALEVAPEMTRVGYGYLVVDGNAEEVTVKVDGVRRGLYTPLGDSLHLRLDAGKHRIELEAGGRKTYAGDVEVPRGQRLGVHGLLSYKPERGSAVVTGALTVGAIVGGVALFKQSGQASTPTSTTPTGMTPTSVAPWFKVGGAVSLGLAGLLGFSTVYVLATDSKPPSRVRLDKVKDLDEDELDTPPPGAAPGPRERLFGSTRQQVAECRGPAWLGVSVEPAQP